MLLLGGLAQGRKRGAWLFRQSVVSIEQYDGFSLPETIDLNFFSTWIQIRKVPMGYRQDATIKNLTEKKVGKIIESQLDVKGAGNFIRVKVRLDVRKPLARFVSIITEGNMEVYPIKFEKMPRFCGACGYVGRTHLECGMGEFDEDKLKWGDFLKADWDSWHSRGGGGGRGSFSGRGIADNSGRESMGGRGHGAGNQTSWRYNALAFVDGAVVHATQGQGTEGKRSEKDTDDTAASPVKRSLDVDDKDPLNPHVKHALELEDECELPTVVTEDELVGNGLLAMATDEKLVNKVNNTLVEKERAKRTKKDGANSSSIESSGSRDYPVRSQ
jgi:hypothetical protein